jgi:hypothetical protein
MMIPVLAQLGADDAARSAAAAAASTTTSLVVLAVVVLMIAAMWRVFERAGEHGWAVLVPIYNLYILCRVAGMSPWWMLAAIIPFVNIIFMFANSIGVAQRFGKGVGYGIGLALLPFIFWPMLAWGDSAPAVRTA